MAGTERIFIDSQYLKFFKDNSKLSLFSRARATVVYNDNTTTNLFTGGYLNYTIYNGFGLTTIGRVASNGSGVDVGIHYFKKDKNWMIYTLPSINVNSDLLYSWFSMIRYTPLINDRLKLYSSLELFSAFLSNKHATSVQRIRLGLDTDEYQYGVAVNMNQRGIQFQDQDYNLGLFLRKTF